MILKIKASSTLHCLGFHVVSTNDFDSSGEGHLEPSNKLCESVIQFLSSCDTEFLLAFIVPNGVGTTFSR
jgi:hypothetical protein